ncbi:hypothetical protein FHT19_001001 [Novosphingobium sp. SG919]|nr:hypothetical protein [Novosphingobium sp. SG919]
MAVTNQAVPPEQVKVTEPVLFTGNVPAEIAPKASVEVEFTAQLDTTVAVTDRFVAVLAAQALSGKSALPQIARAQAIVRRLMCMLELPDFSVLVG